MTLNCSWSWPASKSMPLTWTMHLCWVCMAIMLSVDAKWKGIKGNTTSNERRRCIFLNEENKQKQRMEDRQKSSLGLCLSFFWNKVIWFSFICAKWLERMLAPLIMPWAHPPIQSHHSQFNVSSRGCQTEKLFCILTWVVTSLFLKRVGWLLRTWMKSFIAMVHFWPLAVLTRLHVISPMLFPFWVPWDSH